MSAVGWIALVSAVVFVGSIARGRWFEGKILDADLCGGYYAIGTIALAVLVISGALSVFI
jgi:hypothetical protein